ncbi:hypothetical protein O7632_31545 [Solwaraspora sp. WMMD406]|uniref:hypothetical protein n=1 Tax=Solwaraspora sp. WMMD406 TaxID=3016095 RepID=UPI0024175F19|nr:hypothetical protein [Solwaraspora sp. WMMD406]MDG4768592.1 hypothetical protein [Solwaraspora sp. WMMD406]
MPDRPINWPPTAPPPGPPPLPPSGPLAWTAPPPGWVPPRPPQSSSSGLFPSVAGPFPVAPARPTYREPHPVRPGALAIGAVATALWLLLTGLLGQDLRGYAIATLAAGGVAWGVAVLLGRIGDRGVAAGIALAVSAGWSIATVAVATHWIATGDWPLW